MTVSRAIRFWKMSGSGNDFVVIDNRNGELAAGDVRDFTRAVCRRRISAGADGVVLISDSDESGVDFNWRYINADGSDGEMCGNGAMCGARFAVLNGIAPERCVFRTESGLVRAAVDRSSTRVRIDIENPGTLKSDLAVNANGHDLTVHAIKVGVPHVVAVVDDADAFAPGDALIPLGRAIRHHRAFAPEGANFNTISQIGSGVIRMRTYERGVEDETLACGTGSIASAIVATALGLTEPPVDVVTSSGRTLQVDFSWQHSCAVNVTLTGEASIVIRGEIDPEALA
jgi:diaminopimelate epimerase